MQTQENIILTAKLIRVHRAELFNTKKDGTGKDCHLGTVLFKGEQLPVQIPTKVEADAALELGEQVNVAAREYNGQYYFTVIGRPIVTRPITSDFFHSLLEADEVAQVTETVEEAS